MYLWHRERGKLLEALEGHSDLVNSVAWSRANPLLAASASDDGTVRLWGTAEDAPPTASNGAAGRAAGPAVT